MREKRKKKEKRKTKTEKNKFLTDILNMVNRTDP